MAWEPAGRFLISVSADQTARLHAPWMHSVEGPITWHEIARPQIHGYDLSSIAVLGPFRYASGAEEKIIRVFEAPNNFRANLNRICGTQLSGDRLIFFTDLGTISPTICILFLQLTTEWDRKGRQFRLWACPTNPFIRINWRNRNRSRKVPQTRTSTRKITSRPPSSTVRNPLTSKGYSLIAKSKFHETFKFLVQIEIKGFFLLT